MMDEETMKKWIKVRELFISVYFPLVMRKFFDLDSKKLLDEKIRVLTALKEGRCIAEIEGFYDILELYPRGEVDEDGMIKIVHWD